METSEFWARLSEESRVDRRKDRRIPLAFPIEISGFNREGYFFRELSMTSEISENGCRFDVCQEIEKDGVVAIRVARRDSSESGPEVTQLFRIAWIRPRDGGFVTGAAKLQGDNLWRVVFPKEAGPISASLA